MTIKEAIDVFSNHQEGHLKKRSIHSYKYILNKFGSEYGKHQFESIGSDDVLQFLEDLAGNSAKATRKLRYAQLKTFFNFIIGKFDLNVKNPCSSSHLLRRLVYCLREHAKF